MELNKEAQRNLFNFLSRIARYMDKFASDIFIDLPYIIERLEKCGEVELYVAKTHFDTESRFMYGKLDFSDESIAKARAEGRRQKWGEYVILLKLDTEHDAFTADIERGREDAPEIDYDELSRNLFKLNIIGDENN